MSVGAQCHHPNVMLLDAAPTTAGPPKDQRYLWCRDCGLLLTAFPKVDIAPEMQGSSVDKTANLQGALATLRMIASNTCCGKCQEAALVAREFLNRTPSPEARSQAQAGGVATSVGTALELAYKAAKFYHAWWSNEPNNDAPNAWKLSPAYAELEAHLVRMGTTIDSARTPPPEAREPSRRAVGWIRQDGSLHKGCPPLGEPTGWKSLLVEDDTPEARETAEPDGTLHDDGCFTWRKGHRPPERDKANYAGWRADFWLAPPAVEKPAEPVADVRVYWYHPDNPTSESYLIGKIDYSPVELAKGRNDGDTFKLYAAPVSQAEPSTSHKEKGQG